MAMGLFIVNTSACAPLIFLLIQMGQEVKKQSTKELFPINVKGNFEVLYTGKKFGKLGHGMRFKLRWPRVAWSYSWLYAHR